MEYSYDTVTFTVKVDALVASRFADTLREQRDKGVVIGYTDDREPPLDAHRALEAAVKALLRESRSLMAVKLVMEYFGWPMADARDAVYYYKYR